MPIVPVQVHVSKSMRIALHELHLAGIFVVHPGKDSYSLDDGIEVIGTDQLARLPSLMRPRRR